MSAALAALVMVAFVLAAPAADAPPAASGRATSTAVDRPASQAPAGATVDQAARPVLPEGYRWHVHSATRGAFAVPPGWHVAETVKDGVQHLMISREKLTGPHPVYQVGFTLNTYATPEDRGSDGLATGKRWVQDHLARNEGDPPFVEDLSLPPFRGQRFRVMVPATKSPDGVAYRLWGAALVNEKTGAVHLLWFEAPETEAERAWEFAEVMLEFVLDETF